MRERFVGNQNDAGRISRGWAAAGLAAIVFCGVGYSQKVFWISPDGPRIDPNVTSQKKAQIEGLWQQRGQSKPDSTTVYATGNAVLNAAARMKQTPSPKCPGSDQRHMTLDEKDPSATICLDVAHIGANGDVVTIPLTTTNRYAGQFSLKESLALTPKDDCAAYDERYTPIVQDLARQTGALPKHTSVHVQFVQPNGEQLPCLP